MKKIGFGLMLFIAGTVSAQNTTNSCCESLPSRFGMVKPAAPEGMIWIPGGEFTMGGNTPLSRPNEKPLHRVRLDGYWISRTPITNAEFKDFVDATGYVTTAEKKPLIEDIMKATPPGTPMPDESMLFPASMVFSPPNYTVDLNNALVWWHWQKDARWNAPTGPGSSIEQIMDHPVVQVSWYDAKAYAEWKGMSLPTEAQWEYAARGGHEQWSFTWGEERVSAGKPKVNIWEGTFPARNTRKDGYYHTSPVTAFPPNDYGLYDMSGNVWEWVNDWYHEDAYKMNARNAVTENPYGPSGSYDPREPSVPKRVTRGGSFLCNDAYCSGYRPAARMHTTPDTSLNHTGFRIVWNPPKPE